MANRWAVANGNWSATATWNGGTLPTAADDVFANNFTVTIDQNVTALSIRTEAAAGINAGGGFTLAAAYDITADLYAGGSSCLTYSANSPTAVTITGNLFGSSTTNSTSALSISGTGTCTINGNLTGGTGASSSARRTVSINNSATVIINGNLSTSATGSTSNLAVSINANAVTLTITGNLTAGLSSVCFGNSYPSGSVTVTGSLIASTVSGGGIPLAVNGQSVTVNGNQNMPSTATNYIFDSNASSGSAQIVFNGDIIISHNSLSFIGIRVSGVASSVTINGNVTYNGNGLALQISSSNCTTTITGNLIRNGTSNGGFSFSGTNSVFIINGNISATLLADSTVLSISGTNQTLTINGDILHCLGGAGGTGGRGTLAISSTNITATINGNVIGAPTPVTTASYCIFLTGSFSGTLTINGTVTAGDLAGTHAIYINNSSTPATLTIRRVVGNGFGVGVSNRGEAYAVFSAPSALNNTQVLVKEFEFGPLGAVPVRGFCQIVGTTDRIALFRNSSGTQITLVDPATVVTPPAVTDVRSGVVYNNGNLTGTLAVPPVNQVAAGVAVDNTVGTAALTQASVWDYALSSASSVAGSVGEKLKKAASTADVVAFS